MQDDTEDKADDVQQSAKPKEIPEVVEQAYKKRSFFIVDKGISTCYIVHIRHTQYAQGVAPEE